MGPSGSEWETSLPDSEKLPTFHENVSPLPLGSMDLEVPDNLIVAGAEGTCSSNGSSSVFQNPGPLTMNPAVGAVSLPDTSIVKPVLAVPPREFVTFNMT